MRMYGSSRNTFRRVKEEYDCVHELHELLAENSRRNGLFRTVELYSGMMMMSVKNIEDYKKNGEDVVILTYQKASRTDSDMYRELCDNTSDDYYTGRSFLINNKFINENHDPFDKRLFIYNDPIKFGTIDGGESILNINYVVVYHRLLRKRHYATVQKRT